MNRAYLLVDGENIDRTLGQILNSKPSPSQRPRWDRILNFVEKKTNKECKGLFFLNANAGIPGTFVQALITAKYTPIPLTSNHDIKIVDEGINKTLRAIGASSKTEDCTICLISHDADFYEAFAALDNGKRTLAVIAFKEYLSGNFNDIPNLQVFDLEDEVSAFRCDPLPRLRTIDIEDFDPSQYL